MHLGLASHLQAFRFPALVLSAALLLPGCSIWDSLAPEEVPDEVFGRRPVYLDVGGDPQSIYSLPPRALRNGAGIVTDGIWLYIIDLNTGVHVIDNTDPEDPISIAFIWIPGVRTATILDGRLIANNLGDLVTINIDDPTNAQVVDRDSGLFLDDLNFPEGFFGFFECYDPSRGILLDWEDANIRNPKCRTF